MARIAHLVAELGIGGTEVMVSRLVRHLDPRRFPSTVIALTTGGPVESDLKGLGIPVHCLNAVRGMLDPRLLLRLHDLLRTRRIDLLQTYSYAPNVFGLIAARAIGIPVIWGLRCSRMDFSKYGRSAATAFQLNRVLSRYADLIVANSEAGKRYHVSKGFSGRRMVVVPNGFELDRFKADGSSRASVRGELGMADDAVVVGHVARYDAMKDHETFLRAAASVSRARSSARFVMVGRGVTPENPALRTRVSAEGLDGKVSMLGERRDIERLMAAMDFLVCSSEDEGFPNVVAEAMACGIPCVVTDAGDAPRIVEATGLVSPPRDPGSLARQMAAMIDRGAPARVELGSAARRRIETQFEIGAVAARFERLYEDVLGPGA